MRTSRFPKSVSLARVKVRSLSDSKLRMLLEIYGKKTARIVDM